MNSGYGAPETFITTDAPGTHGDVCVTIEAVPVVSLGAVTPGTSAAFPPLGLSCVEGHVSDGWITHLFEVQCIYNRRHGDERRARAAVRGDLIRRLHDRDWEPGGQYEIVLVEA